ncbi:MAG: GC-type dockerin domain-anchored protein, partial [Phycisphaerales bacterium JB041]
LNGSQTLFVDFTCTGAPRIDPLERLLITSACGIEAIHRDGDESYWRVDLGTSNVAPVIGADATAYAAAFLGDISAIRHDGSIAWTSGESLNPTRMLAVRQDVGRLVYVSAGFGTPQSVSGMDPADGSALWSVPLRQINGHNELVETWEAPTNPAGSTVYFTTRFTSLGAPGAVWAVAMDTNCPADFNGDGDVNTLDVLTFLNAWNAAEDTADFNQDGGIDTLDVLAFLNAWNTGC